MSNNDTTLRELKQEVESDLRAWAKDVARDDRDEDDLREQAYEIVIEEVDGLAYYGTVLDIASHDIWLFSTAPSDDLGAKTAYDMVLANIREALDEYAGEIVDEIVSEWDDEAAAEADEDEDNTTLPEGVTPDEVWKRLAEYPRLGGHNKNLPKGDGDA